MSLVERMRGSIERRRDPLINTKKLEELVDEGRSPRVVQSDVDLGLHTGDYVLFIPPQGHSWDTSTLVPSDVEDGIVLFVNDTERPRPTLIRVVTQEIIDHLKPAVPDLFALLPDPFAPPSPSSDS